MRGVVLALVVCAGCLDPTQITVTIDASYDCDKIQTDTALWIGDASGASGPLESFTATKKCTGMRVGDIVVVPRKSSDDTVYVRVLAGIAGTDPHACSLPLGDAGPDGGAPNIQCIEAKRILRFVPHSKLNVRITLDSACINVHCPNATETCKNGICVDAHESSDAGSPVDSGTDAAPVFKPAQDLFGSFDDVCAIAADGPYCFGSNSSAQLGVKLGTVIGTPVKIALPSNITQIAVGDGHICASEGSSVWCWGAAGAGQLGRVANTKDGTDPTPTLVPATWPNTPLTSLVAGATYACVISKQPWCWGVMLANIDYGAAPTMLPLTYKVLSAGAHHACAIGATNGVACWGDNSSAQLDVDPGMIKNSPQPISGPTNAVWVSSGFDHNTASDDATNPQLCTQNRCNVGWGSNAGLELVSTSPAPIFPTRRIVTNAVQIAMGDRHICVLDSMGVRCRGANDDGQVGGAMPDTASWVTTTLADTPKKLALGRTFSCALTVGGHVYCWGTVPNVISKQAMPAEVLLP